MHHARLCIGEMLPNIKIYCWLVCRNKTNIANIGNPTAIFSLQRSKNIIIIWYQCSIILHLYIEYILLVYHISLKGKYYNMLYVTVLYNHNQDKI